jgi:hypothetical protein
VRKSKKRHGKQWTAPKGVGRIWFGAGYLPALAAALDKHRDSLRKFDPLGLNRPPSRSALLQHIGSLFYFGDSEIIADQPRKQSRLKLIARR